MYCFIDLWKEEGDFPRSLSITWKYFSFRKNMPSVHVTNKKRQWSRDDSSCAWIVALSQKYIERYHRIHWHWLEGPFSIATFWAVCIFTNSLDFFQSRLLFRECLFWTRYSKREKNEIVNKGGSNMSVATKVLYSSYAINSITIWDGYSRPRKRSRKSASIDIKTWIFLLLPSLHD